MPAVSSELARARDIVRSIATRPPKSASSRAGSDFGSQSNFSSPQSRAQRNPSGHDGASSNIVSLKHARDMPQTQTVKSLEREIAAISNLDSRLASMEERYIRVLISARAAFESEIIRLQHDHDNRVRKLESENVTLARRLAQFERRQKRTRAACRFFCYWYYDFHFAKFSKKNKIFFNSLRN